MAGTKDWRWRDFALTTVVGGLLGGVMGKVMPIVGKVVGNATGKVVAKLPAKLTSAVAARVRSVAARVGLGKSPQTPAALNGNARLSPKTTHLYQLEDLDGNYLKTGITSNPLGRYSQKFMSDKSMNLLTKGSRSDMLNLERFIVERDPGPFNFESWAGRFAADVP